jgi:type IV pilus assembly protein PilY1
MMFGESPQMGYVRAAIRNMATPVDYDFDGDGEPDPEWDFPDDGKDYPVPVTANFLYGAMIRAFQSKGEGSDSTNNRTLSRSLAEAYRYLTGQETVDPRDQTGIQQNARRDYRGNSIGEEFSDLVYALDDTRDDVEPHALDDVDDDFYNAPPDNGICGNTYIIYIGNTRSGGNVGPDPFESNRNARRDLESAAIQLGVDPDAATTTITDGVWAQAAYQYLWADEWARLMHDQLGIIFYAVDVAPTPYPDGQRNGVANSELLRSLSAGVGGGKYYRVEPEGDNVKLVLEEIFDQIQANNSVFASVALPASTTGNSIFLNQVFIGLFRPDANAFSLWPGNLKQYQLGLATGDITSVRLEDANGDSAIDPANTGFLEECAVSFWTSGASDGYWSFDPQGTCGDYNEDNPSPNNSPDGPYVEKGAQGYMMRGMSQPLSRNVLTCRYDLSDCNSNGLEDFDTENGNITQAMLDSSDPSDPDHETKNALIEWAIGRDLEDDNSDDDDEETRAYVHADVIHSRPVAINFSDNDLDPSVVVFYGSNDGMLKAINGNKVDSFAGAAPGQELWAFMPPEFYDQIKHLKMNERGEPIKVPATGPGSVGKTGIPKPYGIDGIIVAYQGDIVAADDSTLADRKYIYAGMRRGGRSIYAFDVTDPAAPQLLWKKGCDDSECDPGNGDHDWNDIGQTWAPVSVAFLAGEENPILLIGGGYDPCEDTDEGSGGANHSCGSDPLGSHIYIVDGYTGDLLNVLDTERSVAGGVTVVPVSEPSPDNFFKPGIQFAYTTDTGGNIYRITGPLDGDDMPTPITDGTGSADPATWEIQRIADFGCGVDATSTCESGDPNRKFLFAPDIVRVPRNSTNFRVLAGTGDREKPVISYAATTEVQNYFVSFVDQPLTPNWPDSNAFDVTDACGEAVVCLDALFIVSKEDPQASLDAISEEDLTDYPVGYAVELSAEEQVVTGALVVGSEANFSTHIPYRLDLDEIPEDPTAAERAEICQAGLGTATTYNIDFQDAEGDLIDILTGGLVPTPVAGEVLICEGERCSPVPFCIGCGGENSPIGGGTVNTGTSFERSKGRVFWNIEQ